MRENPRACLLPHPFFDGKIEEADRIKGLMLGGDDYILKPFSIEELGARVEAICEGKNELSAKSR